MSSRPYYRPDIDGLRAVAVLAVLFFHLDFRAMSTGFIGVDIFFVISGFLITRLIYVEYTETNSFSFANFYTRRARRLFPAFFVTLSLTSVGAFILLTPEHLERFGGAVVHSVTSLSNFYFWSEAGYFDAESIFKPLLHFWSVSVEEQFYLIWPMLLIAILQRIPRFALPVVLGLGMGSVLLNLSFADGESFLLQSIAPSLAGLFADGTSTVFYLLPFRVFELAIGASIVWTMGWRPRSELTRELLTLAGLAGLAFSLFAFTAETPLYALMPCIATAIIIFAGPSRYSSRLLNNPLAVGIGVCSYSIYLVHWPIIVFYRYSTLDELTLTMGMAIMGVSIAAGAVMYRYVEQPFRQASRRPNAWSAPAFGLGCATLALVIALPAASAWANQGWLWRFGGGSAVEMFGRIDEYNDERRYYLMAHGREDFPRDETKTFLVIGDSMSDDLVIALSQNLNFSRTNVQGFIFPEHCLSAFMYADSVELCSESRRSLDDSPNLAAADELIVSFNHDAGFDPGVFAPLLEYLKTRKKDSASITWFGQGPDSRGFQSVAISMLSDGNSQSDVERELKRMVPAPTTSDLRMKTIADEYGIRFISKYDLFCSDEECKYFVDQDTLMFWDGIHVTVEGAQWFGARALDAVGDGWGSTSFRSALDDEEQLQGNNGGTGLRSPASNPEVAREPAPSIEVAADIILTYGQLLSRVTDENVLNASLLPLPKYRVKAAIVVMVDSDANPERIRFMRTVLGLLARFQEGIDGEQTDMDSTGPDGQTWRSIVDAETLDLMNEFDERYGPPPQEPDETTVSG